MSEPISAKDLIRQLRDGYATLSFDLGDWEELLLIALENGAVYEIPDETYAREVLSEIQGLLNIYNKARK